MGKLSVMPIYLLHHQHDARRVRGGIRRLDGLRRARCGTRTPPSTCLAGGHAIWWRVQAESAAAALALLPRFVARRPSRSRCGTSRSRSATPDAVTGGTAASSGCLDEPNPDKGAAMKVFLAGATGAIGQRLVPRLVAHGHQVVATTRSPDKTRAPAVARSRAGPARWIERAPGRRGGRPGRAGRHRPRDDGARTDDQPQALRPGLRAHERAAHARNRLPARRGRGCGRATLRRAELHRLAEHPRGRPDQGRARSTRPEPAGRAVADAGGDPLPRARGPRRARRGDRAALRQPLRPGRLGLAGRPGPQAQDADHRNRRRRLVVDPRRRCGCGDRCRRRGRRAGIYNIVDDDPAPVSEWLPALARSVGARPPRHVRCGSAGWPPAMSPSR